MTEQELIQKVKEILLEVEKITLYDAVGNKNKNWVHNLATNRAAQIALNALREIERFEHDHE